MVMIDLDDEVDMLMPNALGDSLLEGTDGRYQSADGDDDNSNDRSNSICIVQVSEVSEASGSGGGGGENRNPGRDQLADDSAERSSSSTGVETPIGLRGPRSSPSRPE